MTIVSSKVKVDKNLAKKKSLGRPRRPLSAYNIFFKNERQKIVLEQKRNEQFVNVQERHKNPRRINHAHVGFANLASIVSKRWKSIDPDYKNELEEMARLEKIKYKKAVLEWKMKMKEDQQAEHKDLESGLEPTKNEGVDETDEDLARGFKHLTKDISPTFAGINEALAFLNETSAMSKKLKDYVGIGSSSPRVNAASIFSPIPVSPTYDGYEVNRSPFKQTRSPFISVDEPCFCPPCNPSESSFNVVPTVGMVAESKYSTIGDPANRNIRSSIMMKANGSQSLASCARGGSYTRTAADPGFIPNNFSLSSDQVSALNQIHLPFSTNEHLEDICQPCNTSGSILNYDVQTRTGVYTVAGMLHERRSSLPDSAKNIDMFSSTMIGHNKHSLFSGFREMDYCKSHAETREPSIEEIRRFFGIDSQSK